MQAGLLIEGDSNCLALERFRCVCNVEWTNQGCNGKTLQALAEKSPRQRFNKHVYRNLVVWVGVNGITASKDKRSLARARSANLNLMKTVLEKSRGYARNVIVVGIRHVHHEQESAAINDGFADAVMQFRDSDGFGLVSFCNPLQKMHRNPEEDPLHCSDLEYESVLRRVMELI
jgi:hypothetical protein